MQVKIENYRGWEISFDTDKETFYCHSEQYDKDATKKSYTSTKKFIDDFIKENQNFTPIWCERKGEFLYGKRKILIIGIRKDGRFIIDNKGTKEQLSEYSENDYILYNQENEKYRTEIQEIEKEMESLRLKRNAVLKKVTGVGLKEYKKTLSY